MWKFQPPSSRSPPSWSHWQRVRSCAVVRATKFSNLSFPFVVIAAQTISNAIEFVKKLAVHAFLSCMWNRLPFAPTLPVFSRGPNDCLPNSLPDAFVCPTRCHDFLVKSAQSLASRGLAPDALSAHLLTPQVGAFNCFARPCAQCFCLPNLHFNPRPAAVPKHSRAGGGAKHLPAGGGAKPPPLLPRGRRRCQAPPGPAEVPNTSRLAAVPTPSPSPAAGSGAKHPPAGGGAKHPPAGGGAKHPPAGGGAKCVNFFEPREVDVPVSTRHSFCAVSLRRTSHRP